MLFLFYLGCKLKLHGALEFRRHNRALSAVADRTPATVKFVRSSNNIDNHMFGGGGVGFGRYRGGSAIKQRRRNQESAAKLYRTNRKSLDGSQSFADTGQTMADGPAAAAAAAASIAFRGRI